MAKHKHYDLIVKWAENPDRHDVMSDGRLTTKPMWNIYFNYELIDKHSGIGYTAIDNMINLLIKTADDVKRITKESQTQKIVWIRNEKYEAYLDTAKDCGNGNCFFVSDLGIYNKECSEKYYNKYYFVKKES